MTEIEIPIWATIRNGKRLIKCPKCKQGWCSEKSNKMICLACNFATYTSKLEGFWIKNQKKEARKMKLEEIGMTETQEYFCTLCRVSHVAGSTIGFKHIEHLGDKKKLRICSVPGCNTPLSGRQKKFGCAKDCNIYYEWQHTCVECGHNFGFKGDGYTTTKLCFKCSNKSRGAVIEDWEIFGLDPTVAFGDVVKKVRQLRKSKSFSQEHKAAFARLNNFYTETNKEQKPF